MKANGKEVGTESSMINLSMDDRGLWAWHDKMLNMIIKFEGKRVYVPSTTWTLVCPAKDIGTHLTPASNTENNDASASSTEA